MLNDAAKKHQIRNRFVVEPVGAKGEGWNVIDKIDDSCLEFNTKVEAEANATFCREYVKRWGDVDLNCYPYDIETPLSYDEQTERTWNKETTITHRL